VHTPEQIAARKRGRPAGSVKGNPKVATAMSGASLVVPLLQQTGHKR